MRPYRHYEVARNRHSKLDAAMLADIPKLFTNTPQRRQVQLGCDDPALPVFARQARCLGPTTATANVFHFRSVLIS